MKKKIIYGLLFAVALVTASSSFVSCKDYEGDDYANWQNKWAESTINQNSSLKELIEYQKHNLGYELQNALANAKDPATIAAINGYIGQLNGITYDPNSFTSMLNAIKALNTLSTQTELYTDDSLKELRKVISDSLANAYDSIIAIHKQVRIDSARISRDSLTTNTRIDTLSIKAFNRMDSLYKEASHLADSALKVAKDSVFKWYIQDLQNRAAALEKQDSAFQDSISRIDSILLAHADSLDAISKILGAHGDSINALNARCANLLDSVLAHTVRINDIEKAYKAADKVLQQQINLLNNDLNDVKADVKALNDAIEDIVKFARQEITGIEIQGTYNNLFGYFALPVGIQSNVLAAYYGQFDAPVSFPAGDGAESALWVGGIAKATASELPDPKNGKYTAGAGMAFDESEGNAGTLYVTVNPSNVDFTGKTFDLRSSDNKVSSFKLGTLQPSQKRLMWGLTRAGANGFYEAKATLSKEDALNASLRFDMASVKGAVKDIVNNWRNPSNIDKSALANAVYKNLQQNVARLGVQTTWQDAITGEDKSYVSKYDIAAVTAKPLGFDFLYGSDFSPYVTKIQDRFDGKVHAIESEIKSMLKFNMGLDDVPSSITLSLNPSTTTLTANVYAAGTLPKEVVITNLTEFINELKNATPSISTDLDKQPHLVYTYNDNTTSRDELAPGKGFGDVKRMSVDISDVRIDYEIQTSPTVSVTNYNVGDLIATAQVDITGFINDINNSLATGSAISGLNAMLHDVSDLQSRVDTKLGEVSSMISKYLATLLKASDKAFGIIASPLKNPNRFIAPAMFATADAKTVVSLSSEEILPTQAKAGSAIALFPTSLTGELLAPAFKKYIAVTKVTGASVTPEQINAAIKDFNTVLDGNAYNQSKPMVIATQESWKGATVEIIYEALGYNGKVAGRKYYITFK